MHVWLCILLDLSYILYSNNLNEPIYDISLPPLAFVISSREMLLRSHMALKIPLGLQKRLSGVSNSYMGHDCQADEA